MSIGEQIRKHRKGAGISQKELGNRLGISQQQIAQYENGKRIPKIETLQKIAIALGVPSYEILGYDRQDALNYAFKVDTENSMASEDEKKKSSIIRSSLLEDKQTDVLLAHFRNLNNTGRSVAIERVEELTRIADYSKKNAIKVTKKNPIIPPKK